ncbi:MAG TPA: B12-binding domain-containing radical SAM protein [Nitrospinaceae bacterium]|jgi:radical SAM superfamily enzyme YgiQ (UPF0313 family)|nr:B12-binding domain-containing radical SAM protein [Nitrospinaceae bacterium]HIO23046.1 B12-binding domain-containing radical SAM protein [Nitrospinaceae bacterium]
MTRDDTILLYNPNPEKDRPSLDVPLSLLAASKYLDKAGYKIKIIKDNLYENHLDVLREAAKNSPIMGVSAMTGYQIHDGLEACKIAKEANKDIKFIWGGYHPTIYPVQTLENPYVDIVVKGKGEMAFYELIERIVEGESLEGLEGVYWKENGKVFSNPDRAQAPLDDDPPMPYHLVDIEKCLFASEFGKRTISYVSSYGCPYSCTFCVEVGVFNRRWVGLRADLVVNDLERLEKEYGVDAINFYDSLFFVSVKRAKGILQGVLDRKLTVRLGNLYGRSRQLNQSDDELWELLEKTRTYSILCGAESGDQDALDIMNKEMDVEDNIKFAKKCQDYGIKVIFSTLVGVPFPDHTYEEIKKKTDEQIEATLNLFDKCLSFDSRHRGLMFIYAPFPGTPMYDEAVKLGFKAPTSLEEWSKLDLLGQLTPWVTKQQADLVNMMSQFIFMFFATDTIVWAKEKVKNRLYKRIFIMAFKIMGSVAKMRWKYKYFSYPIDYKMLLMARSVNRWI